MSKKQILRLTVLVILLAIAMQWMTPTTQTALADDGHTCPPGQYYDAGACRDCAGSSHPGPECFGGSASANANEAKPEKDPEVDKKIYRVDNRGQAGEYTYGVYCYPYNNIELWQLTPQKKLLFKTTVQDFFSYKTLSKGNGVTTDYYYGDNEGLFFIGTGHNQRAVSFDLAACLVKARLGKSEGGCNVERIAQVKKDIANLDAERSSLLNFIESYGERYDTLGLDATCFGPVSFDGAPASLRIGPDDSAAFNQALIDDGQGNVYQRRAYVNGHHVFLPLVLRG